MANNWLVIKTKRLKTGGLSKFNMLFYFLKSICKCIMPSASKA